MKSCMNELSTNLGTVFLARLVVGNVGEVLLPIIKVWSRFMVCLNCTCVTKRNVQRRDTSRLKR